MAVLLAASRYLPWSQERYWLELFRRVDYSILDMSVVTGS